MSHVYLVRDEGEIARRRGRLPAGLFLEAWSDVEVPGHVWLTAEAKALLDGAGEPLPAVLAVDATPVRIYYGPRLTGREGLPKEDSLRVRIVSAHGIAAAWVTLDQFGERTGYQPGGPGDPIFPLRRPRTPTSHLWRLFVTRDDARVYLREFYRTDPEALAWADQLPVASYADLVADSFS